VSQRAEYIRVLAVELNRIASHLVSFGAYGLDLGASTPVLWCFREREVILDLFESLSGHRFTHNYIRPGGVLFDFPKGWLQQCEAFLDRFIERSWPELRLRRATRFEARTQGVGYIDPQQASPCHHRTEPARLGYPFDIRVDRPYDAYREIAVEPMTEQSGDCWGRYLVRMKEMRGEFASAASPWTGCPAAQSPPARRSPFGRRVAARRRGARGGRQPTAATAGISVLAPSCAAHPRQSADPPELLRGRRIGDVIAILAH
jgi:NADH-quinone oxidoreductase subunit D